MNDTIVVNSGGSSRMSAGALQATVQTVNITGNISALVVPVGFSDKQETQAFPVLVNSDAFPVLGVNQNGILLKDLITANGGSLPEDQWWGPAFNHYFTTESGGLYNVSFQFVKKTEGKYGTRYSTSNNFSHWNNNVYYHRAGSLSENHGYFAKVFMEKSFELDSLVDPTERTFGKGSSDLTALR